ncbi:outer membrane protein/peptidoglycan-associated (lipo)protein [Belliella baltica DSM 15883]|uniref:Outer membrane protein/peptidoglycan-associated (Lipo)protein n=2 Tax=Belliella TaxID=232244 RepID=I3ZAJ0_BELBD|nr:outer membrane protein/peptidoglycan-associated (lipo)protein [Belliella baltica DSM 15883]AFL86258.1 outer membrane protein/peptidoglycan-associated (lipo)protein [Belliella baltica DSM 15883]
MVLTMKNLFTTILIGFLLFLGTGLRELHAQSALLRYADKQYSLDNYQHAAEVYEQAYAKKEKHQTARQIAQSYDKIRDYEKANEWWAKVVKFEEADREDYYEYLLSSYLVNSGEVEMEALLEGSDFTADDFPEIDAQKMKTLYSERANLKLVPVAGVNSSGSDMGMSVDRNKNMYFASDRGAVTPTEKPAIRLDLNNIYSEEKYDFNDREFFRIIRKDTSGNLTELNTGNEEVLHFSDPSFMHEKGLMFYTVTRRITKAKKTPEFAVGTEIYYSKIDESGMMSEHQAMPFNAATKYGVMHPFVDEEAKRIYFSSDMSGGQGGFDLYYVSYDEDLNFGTPTNLGSEINTGKNESHPYRVGDKLYFSSNGHPGLGGLDVFKADYSESQIGNVTNMGAPINSNRDDFAYSITEEGKRYLSSDRTGGQGLDDIYSIEALNKKLIARVKDCDDNMITESFTAILTEKDNRGTIETTRGADGSLNADLNPESNFELKISKKGYFSIYDNTLSTVGLEAETLEREYRLAKIPYQMPVYVDIVYYDLDKSVIRTDAEPTLDKLGELMQKYSFLDLRVASHTDARASDEYNEALSQRRADAVLEFLNKYNIGKERVRAEWFGEEKLTNDCGDGVPCPEPDHQLNRRSELVLEAFPDPDKDYELPKELLDKDICDELGIFEELQRELNAVPIVYFDFDKSNIRPVHKKELERTAIMMKRMKNLNLYIAGHTDQRGSEEYNKSLSERRSAVVMEYLVNRGVEAARMQHEWFGKTQPIHDCGTCSEAQHQENRRTELKLRK